MVQLGSSAFGAFGFEHDAASRMNRVLYPNGVDSRIGIVLCALGGGAGSEKVEG